MVAIKIELPLSLIKGVIKKEESRGTHIMDGIFSGIKLLTSSQGPKREDLEEEDQGEDEMGRSVCERLA